MPRWVLLLAVAGFSVAGMVCAFLAQRVEPVRGLIAVEPVHDFGEVSQGDKVTCEFELINSFEHPLAIRDVIKQCGCTKADCSRQTLAPSERMSVQAEWAVGDRRGHSSQEITVLAVLPDGQLETVNLLMSATIVPDIAYEPGELRFTSDSTPRIVTFSPKRLKDCAIKQVYCTHRAFEARLLADGSHVEVAYRPEALLEDVSAIYLMVVTTSQHAPLCSIPLIAERRSAANGK
ncbi:DUF1573 domain-containing protein [Fimbriiglobus ruber]|uniref:DUF1573 domain-containing protein n=1 Tax=Fimbriiglobus ruber TaxID=1908690 RepID=UPI000B4B4768|nr:DUF1573 domain-containing protein [Fimbriiglobus ruber]